VEAIEMALPAGLYVTGSPYRGIGIPDCVHQGRQTAERIASGMTAAVRQAKMPAAQVTP
jgi:oxygen-dependent protoporphyrinogen oxidase